MAAIDENEYWSTAATDDATESLLLHQILLLHPAQLTVEELIRQIEGEEVSFGQRDAIQRAVRDLAAAGLVHRHGDFVLPTRATLRLNELLGH